MATVYEHAFLRAIAGGSIIMQTEAAQTDLGPASGPGRIEAAGRLKGLLGALDRLSSEGWEITPMDLSNHFWTYLLRRPRPLAS